VRSDATILSILALESLPIPPWNKMETKLKIPVYRISFLRHRFRFVFFQRGLFCRQDKGKTIIMKYNEIEKLGNVHRQMQRKMIKYVYVYHMVMKLQYAAAGNNYSPSNDDYYYKLLSFSKKMLFIMEAFLRR
jgi:hypothetical protein